MKAQAQGHLETLDELDQGHPLREKPRGARGEHLPHDSDGAENKNVNPREVGGRLVLNPFRILAERGVNVKTTGNPYVNAPDPQARSEQGQGIATRHRDLIQHDANQVDGVANLRTTRGNTMDLGVSDHTPGGFSHEGTARVELYDASGQAGAPVPLHPYAHPFRPDYHQAPTGSSNNGTHDYSSQYNAQSTPRPSMKESRIDIIKAAMRDQGII